jgi:putative FmdB family regulatory protein
MPIYEYTCTNCWQEFEVFLSYNEYSHATIICPFCDIRSQTTGGPIIRKISYSPIIYKGDGFYKNDTRNSTTDGRLSGDSEELGE